MRVSHGFIHYGKLFCPEFFVFLSRSVTELLLICGTGRPIVDLDFVLQPTRTGALGTNLTGKVLVLAEATILLCPIVVVAVVAAAAAKMKDGRTKTTIQRAKRIELI